MRAEGSAEAEKAIAPRKRGAKREHGRILGRSPRLSRAESKISLRCKQFQRAMQVSDRMLIHLGKVYLGQTDRLDVTNQGEPHP